MIRNQDLLINLLTTLFPNAKIYLFGSRARGNYRPESDIDIAIDDQRIISLLEIERAKKVVEALNIPQTIDIVDMNRIPDEFKQIILKEGIMWKS